MTYPLYTRCVSNVSQALEMLNTLRERRAVTHDTITCICSRRRAADIALQAEFDELRHAFITPAPREALWQLLRASAAVVDSTEDVSLSLYRDGFSALGANDTALLAAVKDECEKLKTALESLPHYPKSESVITALCALEKAHRTTESHTASPAAQNALHGISAAVFATAACLRQLLLTIT